MKLHVLTEARERNVSVEQEALVTHGGFWLLGSAFCVFGVNGNNVYFHDLWLYSECGSQSRGGGRANRPHCQLWVQWAEFLSVYGPCQICTHGHHMLSRGSTWNLCLYVPRKILYDQNRRAPGGRGRPLSAFRVREIETENLSAGLDIELFSTAGN